MMQPQAKKHLDSGASVGAMRCWLLECRYPGLWTAGGCVSVVLSHQVCDHLLQQPQETDNTMGRK